MLCVYLCFIILVYFQREKVGKSQYALLSRGFLELPILLLFLVFEFDLSELEGEVISPNYPNNYDVSKDYYWRITVKPNQKIQLSFIFMEIEFGFSCNNDYIQVNDGNNVSGANLGKFCGTQKPDAITSFGNQVVIHFHSDNQQTRKGFILRWKAIDIVTTNSPTATIKVASPSIREGILKSF